MHRIAQSLFQVFPLGMASLLPGPLCSPLRSARQELQRTLKLAFRLASTHRCPVTLEPGPTQGRGRIGMNLPEGVRWGRPTAVPLPPSLVGTGWRSGAPHPITVMPHRRAMANVWFLHHGQEALCLRLSLTGAVEILRYRPRIGSWTVC